MLAAIVLLALGRVLPGVLSAPSGGQVITPELYKDLAFYWQYATSSYANPTTSGGPFCAKPNGNTWVANLNDTVKYFIFTTGTQGFIARDDVRKEIVIAFRGTESPRDLVTDAWAVPLPFTSLIGVQAPAGTLVHAGFRDAFNSVAIKMNTTVTAQLAVPSQSNYSIVTTGHSLGGALASLAAVSLKKNFPKNNVRLYTYGQPRTGNGVYAMWINSMPGVNAFRSVHIHDPVPRIPPKPLLLENNPFGYRHHGIEYWLSPDPASAQNTTACPPPPNDFEDSNCALSGALLDLDVDAHSLYYGINSSTKFCT